MICGKSTEECNRQTESLGQKAVQNSVSFQRTTVKLNGLEIVADGDIQVVSINSNGIQDVFVNASGGSTVSIGRRQPPQTINLLNAGLPFRVDSERYIPSQEFNKWMTNDNVADETIDEKDFDRLDFREIITYGMNKHNNPVEYDKAKMALRKRLQTYDRLLPQMSEYDKNLYNRMYRANLMMDAFKLNPMQSNSSFSVMGRNMDFMNVDGTNDVEGLLNRVNFILYGEGTDIPPYKASQDPLKDFIRTRYPIEQKDINKMSTSDLVTYAILNNTKETRNVCGTELQRRINTSDGKEYFNNLKALGLIIRNLPNSRSFVETRNNLAQSQERVLVARSEHDFEETRNRILSWLEKQS